MDPQIGEGKMLHEAQQQGLQSDAPNILETCEGCPQQLFGKLRSRGVALGGSVRAALP